MPKRAISEVLASTFQVTSGSGLSREVVKLAVKLLEVSSRILRVLVYRSSSVLIFCFAGDTGMEDGRTQDETELNTLKERVMTLSSEMAALEGKLKKLSQSRKG